MQNSQNGGELVLQRGFTLVELLVVLLVVSLLSASLLVTALPGDNSQVKALTRELERRMLAIQQQAKLTGLNYGLLVDAEARQIDVLVFAPSEDSGALGAAAETVSEEDNKSGSAMTSMLMELFGLKYQVPEWSWQRQERIRPLKFPEEVDLTQLANAATELSRQMALIAKPKPSLLDEMLGIEDEQVAEAPEPNVLFSASGSIRPISTFTIQMGDEVSQVWWDEDGVIHRGEP